MAYIATIEILLDVWTETEAMDAVAEAMRPLMKPFNDQSCFRDWKWAEDIGRSNIEQCDSPIPDDFVMDNEWPSPI